MFYHLFKKAGSSSWRSIDIKDKTFEWDNIEKMVRSVFRGYPLSGLFYKSYYGERDLPRK